MSLSREEKKRLRTSAKKIADRRKKTFTLRVNATSYTAHVQVVPSTTVRNLIKKILIKNPEMGLRNSTPVIFRNTVLDHGRNLSSYGISSRNNDVTVVLSPPQRFSSLLPEVTYYVKAGTLYEDPDGQVFCENSFTYGIQKDYKCNSHTIPVRKDEKGNLSTQCLPSSVKLQKGYIDEWYMENHGPGVSEYMKTKIPLNLLVSNTNRIYTVLSLPEGQTGWLTSWGIQQIKGSDRYRAPWGYKVEVQRYFANSGLFVKKQGNTLHVDRSSFEETSKLYPQSGDTVYQGVKESEYIDVVFADLL